MEQVIVAAGSNLGNRHDMLMQAGAFLDNISETAVLKSSIWESEPVGPSQFPFLNSVAQLTTAETPHNLLKRLKDFERKSGRENQHIKWGPRLLDLDIIAFGDLVIQTETLIIPHPEYMNRQFVLLPLSEVAPGWMDPLSNTPIKTLIEKSPDMQIYKTNLTW
ncbi:MAG TPA: 2-amino-4-hydroxy-6-hydroxymethyldihydropteridine diphosphokinase [Balneolaceae bacterium]|nr:2-amino-4-hydroxy-6-hydroxymethyldihydropteridine diphosphokinase [Balneolaceae bacterium]